MATETITKVANIAKADHEASSVKTTKPYPDPEWSQSQLNYYKDAEEPPPDETNSTLSEHDIRVTRRADNSPNVNKIPVRIRNIQGNESSYSIRSNGFAVCHLRSQMKDWGNEAELKAVYFPEVSDLLKRETGAKYVYSYEHHVRTGTLEDALAMNSNGAVDINGPVRRVHIDETPTSARREYAYYLRPNDAGNEHLQGRPFGIYNVWKPLKTIRRDPLCLCDPRTVENEDLKVGKVTVPNVGEIENFSIRPPKLAGKHGFVYVREQRPDQALVFRIFDSRMDEMDAHKRTYGVAHTSFVDAGTECDTPRESVEVRSFCIF